MKRRETKLTQGKNPKIGYYAHSTRWSPEDEEYVGLSTEFPSLSWLAPTRAEALKGIRRLVAEVSADLSAEQGISLNHLAGTKLSSGTR